MKLKMLYKMLKENEESYNQAMDQIKRGNAACQGTGINFFPSKKQVSKTVHDEKKLVPAEELNQSLSDFDLEAELAEEVKERAKAKHKKEEYQRQRKKN